MEDRISRRANAMRNARIGANLTLRQLAEKAGVRFVTIGRIERGEHSGNIDTIERIADALKISIDEYVGHKTENSEEDT